MNTGKSTPLSHLPSQVLPPSQEIIPGDDDTTIQAVLNEIAASSGGGASQPPATAQPMQQQPPHPPVTQQQAAFMAAHQAQQQANALSGVDTNTLLAMLNGSSGVNAGPAIMGATQAPSVYMSPNTQSQPSSNNIMALLMKVLTEDFKVATIVFVIYIAVSFSPISNIIGKYFDLSRVPYAELIIKGVIAAILVTLLMKSFVK